MGGLARPDAGARRAGRAAPARARAGCRRELVRRPVRGEVSWGETVAQGRRPYVVLTRDEAIEQLSEVIVVPLTTTGRELSSEVEPDVVDGVPTACVTSFDNLSTIAKGQLVETIATLDPARMDEICRAPNAGRSCRFARSLRFADQAGGKAAHLGGVGDVPERDERRLVTLGQEPARVAGEYRRLLVDRRADHHRAAPVAAGPLAHRRAGSEPHERRLTAGPPRWFDHQRAQIRERVGGPPAQVAAGDQPARHQVQPERGEQQAPQQEEQSNGDPPELMVEVTMIAAKMNANRAAAGPTGSITRSSGTSQRLVSGRPLHRSRSPGWSSAIRGSSRT
ncbi:MAG: type II toxin-antitoxin system PemK/MazF family toxin [Actinobacteria bacterium]|nr:MAG: type II toxin-antitoxin system PemK/MazF family toxin [Actinomycetota bacterium]